MRCGAERTKEPRRKILDAAGRRCRTDGYDCLGVDGLAKEAGVTNGAFHGHFASKAGAFREIPVAGLLRRAVVDIANGAAAAVAS